MPFHTFIVTVLKYDFTTDEGNYTPTYRESQDLFRPFVVQAYDDTDAINKVSDRVGWCIEEAIVDPADVIL
jgi:hypothetical protein